MIIGLHSAGLVVASIWAGLSVCESAAPASIDMTFANNPPVESSALSSKQLSRMPTDTQFSYDNVEMFSVNGITVDQTTPKYQIDYEVAWNPVSETVCLRVERVAVTIEYSPAIYIASEHRPGTCRYEQTLRHEHRHVDTHVITISEFLPQMTSAVQRVLATFSATEFADIADVEPAKTTLAQDVRQALEKVVDEMHGTALLRQKQIDTREEYLRVAKACR